MSDRFFKRSDIFWRATTSNEHKDKTFVLIKDVKGDIVSAGVTRRIMAYCDSMMCATNDFNEGAVGSVHSHPHIQITYVAEGRFRFTVGDEIKEVNKGDTLYIKGGVMHGCVCLKKGVLADFFAPMREDFLK